MAPPVTDRFQALTADLGADEWRVLGAVALERALPRPVLEHLRLLPDRRLDALLHTAAGEGLLVEPNGGRDPLVRLQPDYVELVLRRIARDHDLEQLAASTRTLLAGRSVSDIAVALQRGEWKRFERSAGMRRLPGPASDIAPFEWLRASICDPFDAEWLSDTWGAHATSVATRVLEGCLDAPSPCAPLHEWLDRHLLELPDGDPGRAPLAGALAQHAILRGNAGAIPALLPLLSGATALGFAAAGRVIAGDLEGAQRFVEEARAGRRGSSKRPSPPRCGTATPVLALLLRARDDGDATAAAKRWLAAGASDGERGAARAFRTLLRYLDGPELEQARLGVHQHSPGAGAWELLLTGLTVHLHANAARQATTRAGWAQHLARRGAAWRAAGYEWLGKQTLWLARELDAEYATRELDRRDVVDSRPHAGELSLWDLVTPKPEWKKTLEALSAVSEVVTETAAASYRVAWFVDMSDGTLVRPALQEYRPLAGGWSAGQRLALAELAERREALPPEDLRVLDCTRETAPGKREFTTEAYETLVGHPRVVNGARGQRSIEVVRGNCRIETEEEAGYIRVIVEPEGAELGVNVVPESDERLVVYRVTLAMKRVIDALPRGVRVPKAHEVELLQVLGKLSQSVEVHSPQLGAERQVQADSTPCLRIAPHAGAWLVQAGVRPFGESGRFFIAGMGNVSVTSHTGGIRMRCERDLAAERARLDALVAQCPTLERDPEELEELERAREVDHWVLGEDGVLALLADLRDASSHPVLEWPESPPLRLRGQVTSKTLKGRLRVKKGWYIATGSVRIDEVTEVALRDLVRAPALAGGRFLRLPSGDYLEVERRIRKVLATLAATTSGKPQADLAIHEGAVAALSELATPDSGIEVDAATTTWLEKVERVFTRTYPVPRSLRAELRPYQLDGFRWLCRLSELGLGGCLADDMGLGKTVQLLAFLLTRASEGPSLVVAPTSVCTNWVLEMRRFAPELTPVEYAGKSRVAALKEVAREGSGKVVIASYALLQQDAAELSAVSWGTAVLDEAQFIKNPESLRARAAFGLTAKQRVVATGTPVENHFGDLWSLFHFATPGLLGDLREYTRRFVRQIERGSSADAEGQLRRLVKPYVLRRLKADVLSDLPPVTVLRHEVVFSEDEALRYAVLRKQIHEKLFTSHGKRFNKIEVLAEITRLRRFCCHPRLVFPDAGRDSSKIHTFLELAEELRENGHRALVFSQYVDFLALVREELDERSIPYEYLDGSTPKTDRQARVDAFQKGCAPLFLVSLKAGGFGLNLTAADYVVHLDPWWNPAVEAQATDRAHRIGQTRRVTVYRLVTKDTIEERILELHGKKEGLARSLLQGGDEAGKISAEELVRLIEADTEAPT